MANYCTLYNKKKCLSKIRSGNFTALISRSRNAIIKNIMYKLSDEISDNHCHTEIAYCAEDVTMRGAMEKATACGLYSIAFTEHYLHFYLAKEQCWSDIIYRNPGLLRKNRNRGARRLEQYRSDFRGLNSNRALLGLELDLDYRGKLLLLPEDRNGWDLLIGAVHNLPPEILTGTDQERNKRFLRDSELLLENGVDILAHPLRFFQRGKLPEPKAIFRPLVRMLKEYRVPAEINFHTNEPEPEFFRLCLEEGVKLSFGTDSHNMTEVANMDRHLEFLKQIGVTNPKDVLWRKKDVTRKKNIT